MIRAAYCCSSTSSRSLLALRSFTRLRCVSTRTCSSSSSMANAAAARGAFILFEGVDRSGKSTQARKLVEALQQRGVAAELWNFPDRKDTLTGGIINDYLAGKKELNDQVVHLLFSANRHEKRQALLSALLSGKTLVVDRYAYSGVAYSAAKGVEGMDIAWCKGPDVGLPAPDLVVYLRLSDAVAAARAGFGEERYEKSEFQNKVRAMFEQLCEPEWLVQDAAQPIEQIHEQVLEEALAVVQRCQQQDGEPIKQLWDHQPLPMSEIASGKEQQTQHQHLDAVTRSPAKPQLRSAAVDKQQQPRDVQGVQDVGEGM